MAKIQISPVAFNEQGKIKSVIERFLKSPLYKKADYLIIDDGSTDGTTQVIASYRDQGVLTIRHPVRQGAGAAIRTAIDHACKENYDMLVIMAGNDKDDPGEIPILVEALEREGFDLAQGSRYLGASRTGGDMPFYRKFAVRLHSFLFTMITFRKMTDTTNGFRAMKLSLFDDERINIHQDWLNAYELEPYVLFKAVTLGYQVKEIPVTKIYPPKKLGYTKMRPLIGWWSILRPLIFLSLRLRK